MGYFCNMNFDINKLFGKKLVELRKKQNISQEELADRCGFHRTYIGSLERGEKSPTLNTLEKLSKGLNIEIQDFFK